MRHASIGVRPWIRVPAPFAPARTGHPDRPRGSPLIGAFFSPQIQARCAKVVRADALSAFLFCRLSARRVRPDQTKTRTEIAGGPSDSAQASNGKPDMSSDTKYLPSYPSGTREPEEMSRISCAAHDYRRQLPQPE
jgi:hypothetical protein